LLVWAAIDCIIDKICPNATIVQQSISFGWSTIADDRFTFLFSLN
jgi:hypothetical protein